MGIGRGDDDGRGDDGGGGEKGGDVEHGVEVAGSDVGEEEDAYFRFRKDRFFGSHWKL